MARPLTAKMAVDFNMIFLMATPPAFALQGDVRDTVGRSVAVVVGVLAATIFFHATHETPPRRLARLARGALRDLRSIAASADVGEARLRAGCADRQDQCACRPLLRRDRRTWRASESACGPAARTRRRAVLADRAAGLPRGRSRPGPRGGRGAALEARMPTPTIRHVAVCIEACERAAVSTDSRRPRVGGRSPPVTSATPRASCAASMRVRAVSRPWLVVSAGCVDERPHLRLTRARGGRRSQRDGRVSDPTRAMSHCGEAAPLTRQYRIMDPRPEALSVREAVAHPGVSARWQNSLALRGS